MDIPDWQTPETKRLLEDILSLKNMREAELFFRDLCTETELQELSKRWQAARMLHQETPYSKIVEETGLSTATVARISRWLSGDQGGYRLLLKRRP